MENSAATRPQNCRRFLGTNTVSPRPVHGTTVAVRYVGREWSRTRVRVGGPFIAPLERLESPLLWGEGGISGNVCAYVYC